MRRAAAAVLAALMALPAAATELEAGYSRERLTGGRPDWKSVYLEGAHPFAERHTLYGGLRETERFALRDNEAAAGYYHPLSRDWTGLVEASASPEHHVLPRHSLLGDLAWRAGGGWVFSGGWRHSEYTATGTNLLRAGVERYWPGFRASYSAYNGRPEGGASGTAHRFTLDHYYGADEASRIGIGYTRGRELENTGPPTGIVTTDVRSLVILGRHWLSPAWGLSWEAINHQQGSLYQRRGLRIGVRHRF